jgi:WD40 repeat protein
MAAAKLWDVKTGRQTNRLLGQLTPAQSFGFSPDGRRLAASFHDGTLKLWDWRPGENWSHFLALVARCAPPRFWMRTHWCAWREIRSLSGGRRR